MAYQNEGFSDGVSNTEKGRVDEITILRAAVDDDVVDILNNVDRWNLDEMFVHYRRLHEKYNKYKCELGDSMADSPIHFPQHCTQVERSLLIKNRNIRRNAVHIYDNAKFKKFFKQFWALVHARNY